MDYDNISGRYYLTTITPSGGFIDGPITINSYKVPDDPLNYLDPFSPNNVNYTPFLLYSTTSPTSLSVDYAPPPPINYPTFGPPVVNYNPPDQIKIYGFPITASLDSYATVNLNSPILNFYYQNSNAYVQT